MSTELNSARRNRRRRGRMQLRGQRFGRLVVLREAGIHRTAGGTLRHKGWKAAKVDLPALAGKQDASIVAPAEIEVE